jgi:hypothetical protein
VLNRDFGELLTSGLLIVLPLAHWCDKIAGAQISRNCVQVLRSGEEISLGGNSHGHLQTVRWLFRSSIEPPSEEWVPTTHRSVKEFWESHQLGPEIHKGPFSSVFRCTNRRTSTTRVARFVNSQAFRTGAAAEVVRDVSTLMDQEHVSLYINLLSNVGFLVTLH